MAKTYNLKGVQTRPGHRPFYCTHTAEGFCQVHYKRRRRDGKPGWIHFCIQQHLGPRDEIHEHSFRFMLCSKDGEPDCEFDFPFDQLPHPTPPMSSMEKRVSDWIEWMNANKPL